MNNTKNKAEKLTELLRQAHNIKVVNRFGDGIEQYFYTPEERLKHECYAQENDDLITVLGRIALFNHGCNAGISEVLDNLYGIPIDDSRPFFKARVTLAFQEPAPYENGGSTPKRMQVSFRLNKKVDEVKVEELVSLKERVNLHFPEDYFHYCGKYNYSYIDDYNDARFRISANNNKDANKFFSKLSQVIGFEFNKAYIRKRLTTSNCDKNERFNILGTEYKKHKGRRLGSVGLKFAFINLADKKRDYLIYREKLLKVFRV